MYIYHFIFSFRQRKKNPLKYTQRSPPSRSSPQYIICFFFLQRSYNRTGSWFCVYNATNDSCPVGNQQQPLNSSGSSGSGQILSPAQSQRSDSFYSTSTPPQDLNQAPSSVDALTATLSKFNDGCLVYPECDYELLF